MGKLLPGTKVKFVKCPEGCVWCSDPTHVQAWWRRGFLVVVDTNESYKGAPYALEEFVAPALTFPSNHIQAREWKEGDAPTVAPLGPPTLEFTVDDDFREPKRCFVHGNHLKIVP
jgi:hypothetical protein